MKKFVIQWRKFKSKRCFRNEVMNFLRLIIFLEFFMIFQEFLAFKNHKKGDLYVLDPRGADVA